MQSSPSTNGNGSRTTCEPRQRAAGGEQMWHSSTPSGVPLMNAMSHFGKTTDVTDYTPEESESEIKTAVIFVVLTASTLFYSSTSPCLDKRTISSRFATCGKVGRQLDFLEIGRALRFSAGAVSRRRRR